MKVFVCIIFVSFLGYTQAYYISKQNQSEVYGDFRNYFEFECGGDNSEITVIRRINDKEVEYCEGYLIHSKAALIPAQCLEGYNLTLDSRLQIMINSHGMTLEYRQISKVFIHPSYDSCYGINNYAIVTFDTPFTVDYDIVCFPDQEGIDSWSVRSCTASKLTFVNNKYREKEKCKSLVNHHNYYEHRYKNQLIFKMEKKRNIDLFEATYSEFITCDFVYKNFDRTFIFSSIFYATVGAENDNEYYIIHRQNYVRRILPWVTDVIMMNFIH